MIKVITLDASSWDLLTSTKTEIKIDGSDVTSKSQYWECSVLNCLIKEGYTIKDWQLSTSKGSRTWTFILEKDDE